MSTLKRYATWALSGLLLASALEPAFAAPFGDEPPRCTNHTRLRQPLFGDLHVHTSYSFDSYLSSQRNDPWDAYRFAQGEAITLPDATAEQTITAQLARPLDFAAVTDHAEFLGEVKICSDDPWTAGYWWPICIMSRSKNIWISLIGASQWGSSGLGYTDERKRSYLCSLPGSDCPAAAASRWDDIQRAAEEHYDRSDACRFTTFVAYEYTAHPERKNLHRNVIFRNEHVPATAISTFDTGTFNVPKLWSLLRAGCIEAGTGCDVLAIPHNPNLSGGLMFPDPRSHEEAPERLFFEPVVEMTQHKASSECRFDRLAGRGLNTEDELCDFEQAKSDNLNMLSTVNGKIRSEEALPVSIDEFGSRNMLRNVLKDGLALGRDTGTNPFKMGFIGSTDTHSATPGAAYEYEFKGHLGRRDSGYRNVQDHFFDNPGGLAVVWAEENSRNAIFDGIRRKEAYATSGTRPIVRFFGGWGLDEDLCESTHPVELAYQQGVPMGGDLPTRGPDEEARFLVSALKDPGTASHPGTDLQRIQIVKGWVDESGATHEAVYDVTGSPENGATVDPNTCEPVGTGHSNLCTVWTDEDFDPAQRAFYYVRVLENPTCRWSTLQCQAAGVNPFSENCPVQATRATEEAQARGAVGEIYAQCCLAEEEEPFYSPTIQERAWTSPIWYEPL